MSDFSGNSSDEVLKAVEESKSNPESPFICICFYHTILPPSLFTAKIFDKIRTNYSPDTVGRIFIVDAVKHNDLATKYGVIPTPAIIILWKGEPLLIRRPGWDDATKILGCLKEEEWLSILRFVAALPKNEDRKFLSVNL